MNDVKKVKWVLGTSGVALAGLLLTQLQTSTDETTTTENMDTQAATTVTASSSKEQLSQREEQLVALDWTNFTLEQVVQPTVQPTQQYAQQQPRPSRQTRRS